MRVRCPSVTHPPRRARPRSPAVFPFEANAGAVKTASSPSAESATDSRRCGVELSKEVQRAAASCRPGLLREPRNHYPSYERKRGSKRTQDSAQDYSPAFRTLRKLGCVDDRNHRRVSHLANPGVFATLY